jgi:hypothetical protein
MFIAILNSAGACEKFGEFDQDSVRLIKDVDIQSLIVSPKSGSTHDSIRHLNHTGWHYE